MKTQSNEEYIALQKAWRHFVLTVAHELYIDRLCDWLVELLS